jgi:hypothetical protein
MKMCFMCMYGFFMNGKFMCNMLHSAVSCSLLSTIAKKQDLKNKVDDGTWRRYLPLCDYGCMFGKYGRRGDTGDALIPSS